MLHTINRKQKDLLLIRKGFSVSKPKLLLGLIIKIKVTVGPLSPYIYVVMTYPYNTVVSDVNDFYENAIFPYKLLGYVFRSPHTES